MGLGSSSLTNALPCLLCRKSLCGGDGFRIWDLKVFLGMDHVVFESVLLWISVVGGSSPSVKGQRHISRAIAALRKE